ncbi:MAG: hypothetical protein DMG88_22130 [Acidobacteria bacterium]|nr:MAG: hypothetical protein DMG88_22130 [Acidobacteriota bacterium]
MSVTRIAGRIKAHYRHVFNSGCIYTAIGEASGELKHRSKPGTKLRAIRQQCGLSFRAVYAASQDIAKEHRQPAFLVPPSRLHDIETKDRIPSIHRLYALARIYGRTLNEILSLYGIPL